MYYTVYKITNKVNNKYYIGKHQTENIDDDYMGSGKLLRRAIKKHGIKNFVKEILCVFDNEEEMNAKEKELVTISEHTYNLCEGGQGGFGYINKSELNNTSNQGQIAWERHREKLLENLEKGWYRPRKKGVENAVGAFSKEGQREMIKRALSQSVREKRKETWKKKIAAGWKPWNKP